MNGMPSSFPDSSSVLRISSLLRTSTQSPAQDSSLRRWLAYCSILFVPGSVISSPSCCRRLQRARPYDNRAEDKGLYLQAHHPRRSIWIPTTKPGIVVSRLLTSEGDRILRHSSIN